MTENIFEFPYRVLTVLGLWTVESKSKCLSFLYFLYQSWAFLYLALFTIFLLLDLYFVRENVHRASTNVSATMTVIMLLWKNIQGLFKLQELRRLQRNLGSGLQRNLQDELDSVILERARREIKMAYIVVYLLGFATMTTWLASGLLLVDRTDKDNLPLPVFIPWKHQKSPYYELALAFQFYGGYFVTFDVLSFNLTILGTILQICAEYDILLKNTEIITEWCGRLPSTRQNQIMNDEENLLVARMMARNIRHHQKIIKSANESENCYTHIMLVQFAGSAILITFLSLDLILVTNEINSRLIPIIIFLMLVLSDMYLFCEYGSRLISKSHEFQSRVYDIPWESMNSRNRSVVSVIILKAQRPPRLTVEKFATVDFYSLLGLTKVVYNILYLLLHLTRDR